ncbi:MAG: ATP-binding cassette domain-containing protein [Calditrichaceae bacterium]|nr:ATP-binding cassette domain-containing protein [Calditrichaceae bacterium]
MNAWKFQITINANSFCIARIEDFTIQPNRILLLFGESGIGKTMLSKAVYGLLDTEELQVEINGYPYSKYAGSEFVQKIQSTGFFVFQEPSSHLNPVLKIGDQLSEGILGHGQIAEQDKELLWKSPVDKTFDNLQDIYPQPFRPSGGEKQRLLLTMAMRKLNLYLQSEQTEQSGLFVFDEPSGSLDDALRNRFLNLLLQKFTQKPFTCLIITHDYSIIGEIYRKYQQIVSRFDFKELYKDEDKLAVRPFEAGAYLNWISGVKGSQSSIKANGQPVLQFGNRFRVFNRSMGIFKDKGYQQPVDLIIHSGEIVYLKAASGVGKTTLAKIIMGLYRSDHFNMNLAGLSVSEKTSAKVWLKKIWGHKAGMVFQHADEALDLQADVYHIFKGLPGIRINRKVLIQELQRLFENRIDAAFLKKKVLFLSGGQKQRLNLLRVILLNTDLMILDEPLNGLDFNSIRKTLEIIRQEQQKGRAILIISHNEEIFDSFIEQDRIYYLAALKD